MSRARNRLKPAGMTFVVFRRAAPVLALAAAAATLSACDKGPQAPTDPGVCWQAVLKKEGPPRFNKVAENQPNIESCAARLEELRLQFGRLTGVRRDLVGAYQGRWIFVTSEAIRTSQSLNGASFVLMVRASNGRLVVPGAVEQPAYGTEPPGGEKAAK